MEGVRFMRSNWFRLLFLESFTDAKVVQLWQLKFVLIAGVLFRL